MTLELSRRMLERVWERQLHAAELRPRTPASRKLASAIRWRLLRIEAYLAARVNRAG